jgi:glycosyltransferase involved in cell wall biosynthesis
VHRTFFHYPPLIKGNLSNPLSLSFLNDLNGAEIVHTFQYQSLISNLAVVYARRKGAKVFATDLGGERPNLSKQLGLGRFVDCFLLISEYSRNRYAFRGFNTRVIYGGAGTDLFRPNRKRKNEKRVLYVGRIMPAKGIHHLITALPEYAELRIIGQVYDKSYYSHLLKLGHGKRVSFGSIDAGLTDSLSDELLADEYASASVTVCPSVYAEAQLFALTVIESLACGTPVVGTSVGALPEIVTDGVNGYLVPPRDPISMRQRLQMLLDDPESAQTMGREGRHLVEAMFTWKKVADRCTAAYRGEKELGLGPLQFLTGRWPPTA